MSARKPVDIIEDLSSSVVMVEIKDKPGLVQLITLFEELEKSFSDALPPNIQESIKKNIDSLNDIVLEDTDNAEKDLVEISTSISSLQHAIRQLSSENTSDSASPSREELESREAPSADPAANGEEDSSASAAKGKFELPEWIDDKTFEDFLATEKSAMEELESLILGMEKNGKESVEEFKRRIHTIKGECGVVGLNDLQDLCHAVEDFLNVCDVASVRVDRLLKVKDWMDSAFNSYAVMNYPSPSAEIIKKMLQEPVEQKAEKKESESKSEKKKSRKKKNKASKKQAQKDADKDKKVMEEPAATNQEAPEPKEKAIAEIPSEKVEQTSSPVSSEAVSKIQEQELKESSGAEGGMVERDEETLSMMGEFLQESGEGLQNADEILMNIENDGLEADKINALFRVFHTIKGVAGFLELNEITSLAHITETLLNKVRQGTHELNGVSLDLVFDSTELMRNMMDGVRLAIEESIEIPHAPELQALLNKLEAVIEGKPIEGDEIRSSDPDSKLGEVLVTDGVLDQKEVSEALGKQKETGLRIGEQLVKDGTVKPKQVAQALRSQKRGVEAKAGNKLKETVKVDLERVDSLVEMIGELVIVESMVVNAPEIMGIQEPRISNYLSQLGKITRDLQSVGMRMRMVPIRATFQKMARMVRDLSRKSGKIINFVQSGEDSEMDRSMVEQIGDPLVHMIRNSVDHGIESKDERIKAGKQVAGTVTLSAYHEGGSIVVEIKDDGKGLNREAILEKALRQGLIKENEKLSDQEIYGLIFAPGFSTAKKVTEISGRGVGMDVVKRNIEGMRGRVIVDSVPGEGTTFKMILPLTLAIIDGMVVSCGNDKYIVPTLSIIESIRPEKSMLYSLAEKGELINVRGEIYPLYRMDSLFGIENAEQNPLDALVVILESFGKHVALMVDDVLSQQQVVIKSLESGLDEMQMKFVSGAAILSDGRVGLILNVEEIGALHDKVRQAERDKKSGSEINKEQRA